MEAEERDRHAMQARIHDARLPRMKTLEEFGFNQHREAVRGSAGPDHGPRSHHRDRHGLVSIPANLGGAQEERWPKRRYRRYCLRYDLLWETKNEDVLCNYRHGLPHPTPESRPFRADGPQSLTVAGPENRKKNVRRAAVARKGL